MTRQFDLIASALDGTNLIEASAGTGKTYTISGIYLRLLLEKKLAVEQILVVTFTEAATAELKDRILCLLRAAHVAFTRGTCSEAFLQPLVENHPDKMQAGRLLENAIRAFDQAAIFTIHGFCLRVLQDHPFESGNLLHTELTVNADDFYQEIADDFWRMTVNSSPPCFSQFLLQQNITPDSLRQSFQRYLPVPDLVLTPNVNAIDTEELEQQCRKSFLQVAECWKKHKTVIETILLNDKGLNRNKYRKGTLLRIMEDMDDFVQSSTCTPVLFPGFEKFTAASLEDAVKKGHAAPQHDLFDLCEELLENQSQLNQANQIRLIRLKSDFFQYLRQESARRKQEKNFRSFDDLLTDCYRALTADENSRDLIESLRTRYSAALIDEFQDTDPIQYTIFQAIFGDPSRSVLFLIGDPKQAIYSFRGADIFAYMKAAAGISRQYTLDTNWRSEEPLVNAVNTVFGNVSHPFVYHAIQYHPVHAAPDKKTGSHLEINGKGTDPFRIWMLESPPEKPISKNQIYHILPEAVASEISRLLHSGTDAVTIGGRPISAGDIAVLVRKNREAKQMQEALAACRIPSVIFSSESIFDSFEAAEMERLLAAIVSPGREDRIRSALTTEMIGYNAVDLLYLLRDEYRYEKQFSAFMDYHFMWEKRGFFRMFSQLLRRQGVPERLMQFPDGERRITNIRHVTELIHEAGLADNKGMKELFEWFQKQRQPGREQRDEHLLRLESDEHAVKLVTIHKSKGLEYPIVFCPFTWENSLARPNADLIPFHDESNDMRLTLDLGVEKQESGLKLAEKELLSENLRLLYVALTRAQNMCYLVWGRISQAESSAPGYLFHFHDTDQAARNFKSMSDQDLLDDLERIARHPDTGVRIEKMPAEPGLLYEPPKTDPHSLRCRTFSAAIKSGWMLSSFSSLIHSRHDDLDLAEYLQKGEENPSALLSDDAQPAQSRFSDFFQFPKGALPGTCLHDILEHLEFSEADSEDAQILIRKMLDKYGYSSDWTDSVHQMIGNLLDAPLDTRDPEFKLSCLTSQDRIHELEFWFPVHDVTVSGLEAVFRDHAGPAVSPEFIRRIAALEFPRLEGFMKGFVDLIFHYNNRFYIVDWKSNHLGNRKEDYSPDALQSAMESSLYLLQYHIYTVALDLYLQQRLPGYAYGSHFGGVYYLFLRGFGNDSSGTSGIFHDRPPETLIRRLTGLLCGEGGSRHG